MRMKLEANDRCRIRKPQHCPFLWNSLSCLRIYPSLSLPSALLSIQEAGGGTVQKFSSKIKKKKRQYLLFCVPALLKCAVESTTFLPGSETRARARDGRAEDGHGFLLASTLLTCLSELLPPSFQPGEQLEGKDFRGEAVRGAAVNQPLLCPLTLLLTCLRCYI